MRAREVISKLLENGFKLVSQKGSHVKFRKGPLTTIVPVHGGKDIRIGTIRSIEKQTGIKLL
ncbi:MAG TPA: type II toxin-antitoxin system HicA family toxin [Bacteriovoracaceae bacterium]|nr:type II toxin-antitoxin system HicA family toxin [Bacteriovoracaceae bacterium]